MEDQSTPVKKPRYSDVGFTCSQQMTSFSEDQDDSMISSSQPFTSYSQQNDSSMMECDPQNSPFAKACDASATWTSPVHSYSLEVIQDAQIQDSAFQSIDSSTLVDLMENLSEDEFLKRYILIDCRYPFEYEGGHLKYAVNVFEPAEIPALFFPFDSENARIPIFYCEFSQKRGPEMARTLRRHDRTENLEVYPQLDYPEIYVLDRGYRNFYSNDDFKKHCDPQNYIPMQHPDFSKELSKYTQHKKQKLKRRLALPF